MSEVDDDVLLARAYLSRVGEPASIPLWSFVDRVGPVAAAAAIRRGTVDARVAEVTAARRASVDPEADLVAAAARDITLVVPESDAWPHFAFTAFETVGRRRVADIEAKRVQANPTGEPVPPLALWARGQVPLADVGVRSVGMVGARASTAYGDHVTADLAFGLARAGVTVVSGGAHGIDAVAHRAALAAEGTTVLVSAGGLDRPYPPGNADLFERVAATGLLVSESPPGCAPFRSRFLTRNRLIAALSTGVVVVEAALRSGALNTARHCTDLGRPLMAVPGSVTSAMSGGCHWLLRKEEAGAILVSSVAEVLEIVGGMGEGLDRPPKPPTADARDELDRLDATVRRVFEGLPARRFARPEDVAARSGVDVLQVIRALPELDAAGLLEVADGGYRIAQRLRRKPG